VNRRAPLIAAGAFALVAILAVVLLVLPKMGEVGETQDELETAQDQELTLRAQLAALQDAQANAPETEAEIAEIEDQVPPTADLPELFRLLQGAADSAAVDFFSISPGTPTPSAGYSVIQSQVTVTGTYFSIDEFLFLLETLPRAAKVTTITVAPFTGGEEGTATLNALQMLLTVEFYTTDVSAGPASAPGPTAGTAGGATGATGPAAATTDPGAAT
jgi:Tfp pilus assembly protein PilO